MPWAWDTPWLVNVVLEFTYFPLSMCSHQSVRTEQVVHFWYRRPVVRLWQLWILVLQPDQVSPEFWSMHIELTVLDSLITGAAETPSHTRVACEPPKTLEIWQMFMPWKVVPESLTASLIKCYQWNQTTELDCNIILVCPPRKGPVSCLFSMWRGKFHLLSLAGQVIVLELPYRFFWGQKSHQKERQKDIFLVWIPYLSFTHLPNLAHQVLPSVVMKTGSGPFVLSKHWHNQQSEWLVNVAKI